MANDWAVTHKLDRVELVLDLGGRVPGDLTVTGRSSTKRRALWVYKSPAHSVDDRYSQIDCAHHVLLVAEQDHPRSLDRLEEGLCGGQGWQPGFAGF